MTLLFDCGSFVSNGSVPVRQRDQTVMDMTTSGREGMGRSGCTTALNVVPWEIDGESVLREACPTRKELQTTPAVSVTNHITLVTDIAVQNKDRNEEGNRFIEA
ncbi:hypothetical protein Tco_0911149 [Tanacetum coccineum]|uniref:Uncharacterized protein n=1 Tax=Tanacetum coccineum TaxID=301880 RepID=A0ABQ5CVT7_9ASTR